MKRFLRFLSVLFVACCVGISGVVTPARAESVIDMCERCSYAIWFYRNVSNADKCDDYANPYTSLNTLCKETYNNWSKVEARCNEEGSECISGGVGSYCESDVFGSPLQGGSTCGKGSKTGTYQSGCCVLSSGGGTTCAHGTCTSNSQCTTTPYTECNTTTGCCQSYTHYYWCAVGTSVSTSGFLGCTVQTGLGDFTNYPATSSSAFKSCGTSGTTYKIAYHIETDSSGNCLHNNGTVGSGGIQVYSVTSCNTCSSGTRVSYQWAMDHASFYGIGNMLCSDEDYTHQGTSFSNIYVCVNCTTGYGSWTSYNTTTEKATYENCANATNTTYYRCKAGYYSAAGRAQSTSASALNCQKCGTACGVQTTSDAGSTSTGDCCVSSGSGSDSTGSFSITKEVCMS